MYIKLSKKISSFSDKAQCFYQAPPVTYKTLFSKKKSDVLFLLGSGSSICDYSPAMWQHIKTHDSFGFNFWILNEFVPDFYVGELPVQEDRRELYFDNFFKVKKAYENCLTLFKTPGFYPYYRELNKLGGRVIISKWLRAKSPQELTRKLKYAVRKKHFLPVIYHQTATIDWLIFFSILMGYKKIVLCGVDLNHTEYFFERHQKMIEARGLSIPKNIETISHRTNDLQKNNGLSLSKIIDIYYGSEIAIMPEIYIASNTSALYPQLSLYDWP